MLLGLLLELWAHISPIVLSRFLGFTHQPAGLLTVRLPTGTYRGVVDSPEGPFVDEDDSILAQGHPLVEKGRGVGERGAGGMLGLRVHGRVLHRREVHAVLRYGLAHRAVVRRVVFVVVACCLKL